MRCYVQVGDVGVAALSLADDGALCSVLAPTHKPQRVRRLLRVLAEENACVAKVEMSNGSVESGGNHGNRRKLGVKSTRSKLMYM